MFSQVLAANTYAGPVSQADLRGSLPSSLPASAAAAATALVAPSPSPLSQGPATPDAIAVTGSVMTAVSAALAAVALIFSVGTVLLGQYIDKLAKLRADILEALSQVRGLSTSLESQLNSVQSRFSIETAALADSLRKSVQQTDKQLTTRLQDYESRMSALLAVDDARISLLDAKVGLLQWVSIRGSSSDRFAFHAMLVVQFEQLLSKSADARFRAFGRLQQYLTPADAAELPGVAAYLQTCHTLHGGADNDVRVWCKLFSGTERAAYVEAIAERDHQFC